MRRGFTLIELLIVVSIIVIIASIAVQNLTNRTPAVQDNGTYAPTPQAPAKPAIKDNLKVER